MLGLVIAGLLAGLGVSVLAATLTVVFMCPRLLDTNPGVEIAACTFTEPITVGTIAASWDSFPCSCRVVLMPHVAVRAPVALIAVTPPPVETDFLGFDDLHRVFLFLVFLNCIETMAHFTTNRALKIFLVAMTVNYVSS
jgi:hypothetical protein